jgi:hypothetical protein
MNTENTTNTTNTEMSADELAAMFGGANDLAGKTSHRKSQITPLATKNGVEFYRLRLPNAETKMDVRGRIRVAMRAVEGLEAKGATKLITGIIPQGEDASSKTYLVKVEAK